MWLAKVHVTLKPVVNDPQGLTIKGALRSLGYETVESVRVGKYMEILLEAVAQSEAEEMVREMCRKLLSNPVIENFVYEVGPA